MSFFEVAQKVNDTVNNIVWGPYMLLLLVGTGVFFTVITGVFQVSKIKLWLAGTFGQLFKKKDDQDEKNITPFQAVTTALASTVGTGNIVGVATAIVRGGPGAVFWMWVSAFFGMITKYAEVVLAVKFREVDSAGTYHGGPMYYIEKGLKVKWPAIIFAVLATLATFGIGNMTQANSIASSMQSSFNVPVLVTGCFIAILAGLVIIGGIKRIASVTEKLVPFMAIIYIIGSLVILFTNITKLPGAFGMIFAGAFNARSLEGGVMGYIIMKAMRYGVARGVFSNEAGLGSAPIAHAASNEKDPVKQGFWGIFEVFVDTIIICSLTALVILTSGVSAFEPVKYINEAGKAVIDFTGGVFSGPDLTMAAFSSTFGKAGGIFLTIGILCFAQSTIFGWAYYGEQSLRYLTKKSGIVEGYKVFFIVFTIIGAVGGLSFVWALADTLNGLMAIPNLIALLLLSKVVFTLTKEYLDRGKIKTQG